MKQCNFLALAGMLLAASVSGQGLLPPGVVLTNGQPDASSLPPPDRRLRSQTPSSAALGYTFPFAVWPASPAVAPPVPVREIRLDGASAVADYGSHRVRFLSSLDAEGAVTVQMLDGVTLPTRIVGLVYLCRTNGGFQNVLLGTVKACQGEVLSGTRVIYRDAFAGLHADVLYDYSEHHFAQSIILRQRPARPATFGFRGADTELAVITAMGPTAPAGLAPGAVDYSALNLAGGLPGPASLADVAVQWSTMHIAKGHAFAFPATASRVPVAKRWETTTDPATGETTQYLVESVPYHLLKPELDELSAAAAPAPGNGGGAGTGPAGGSEQKQVRLPRLPAKSGHPLPPFRMAKANPARPAEGAELALGERIDREKGVVLDYLLVSSALLDLNLANYNATRTGPAQLGFATNDYWNGFLTFGVGNTNWWHPTWTGTGGGLTNYAWLSVSTNANSVATNGLAATDGMYAQFIYGSAGGNLILTLTNLLTAGSAHNYYNVYVYGHGGAAANDENTIVALNAYLNPAAPVSYGTRGTTIWGSGWNSTNWEAGQQFVRFQNVDLTQSASNSAAFAALQLTITPNAHGYAEIAGVQIVPSSAVPAATNPVASLINVNFAANPGDKVGLAAIGAATNDFWNVYHHPGVSSTVTVTNLLWSDSSTSAVTMRVTSASGEWNNGVADGMYSGYSYRYGGTIPITFSNLANGTYDFYLYGHSPVNDPGSVFQLSSGTNTFPAKGTTIWDASWNSTNWDESMQYVAYRSVPVVSNQLVTVTVLQDDAGYAIINGLQINLSPGSTGTDSNGDGLPDWWCVQYGLNPHTAGLAGATAPDGLSYLLNYLQGRNPNATNIVDTTGALGLTVFTPLH